MKDFQFKNKKQNSVQNVFNFPCEVNVKLGNHV